MPFGVISRTGPGMRQVVGFGEWSTGRGTFEGEFEARHCNQWGLYGVRVRRDAALFPNYFGQTCSLIGRRIYGLSIGTKSVTLNSSMARGRHYALFHTKRQVSQPTASTVTATGSILSATKICPV